MALDPMFQPIGRCSRAGCGGTVFLEEDQWGRVERCVSCNNTTYLAPADMPHFAKVLPMRALTLRRKAA